MFSSAHYVPWIKQKTFNGENNMTKNQLLNTQMHKLGLPNLVVNHFYHPRDSEEDICTLKEFFEMNHEIFTHNTPFFTKKSQKRRFFNNYWNTKEVSVKS